MGIHSILILASRSLGSRNQVLFLDDFVQDLVDSALTLNPLMPLPPHKLETRHLAHQVRFVYFLGFGRRKSCCRVLLVRWGLLLVEGVCWVREVVVG